MRSRFLLPLLPALLLGATPALGADGIPSNEDVQYPNEPIVLGLSSDAGPFVTPDVTYSGPHAVLVKHLLPAPAFSMAAPEDVTYPTADPLRDEAAPARPAAPASAVASCDCPCGHHG